ncbi:hypothetical protein N3K66_004449 [Trichothecium roseum]|uniref:Uncharacterized protein n=1 Tax=Trichothecium roseum TaxID=47278 RepID=A0ACC0V1F0_9HYPO|nr:hypothetical protein N3K66_004449 [Trichothecium roseum]
MLAHADSFAYVNGTLLYTVETSDLLNILRLDGQMDTGVTVDTHRLMRDAVYRSLADWKHKFTPLHAFGDVVSGKLECVGNDSAGILQSYTKLIVFNVAIAQVVASFPLPQTEKVFVRGNDRNIYFGFGPLNSIDYFDPYSWIIISLKVEKEKCTRTGTIRLDASIGGEIGVDVCFEEFGDSLYVATTQQEWGVYTPGTFCYRATRISPNLPETSGRVTWAMIGRGVQQGTVFDERWQTLGIHRSEATGEILLYETRMESVHGGAYQQCVYRKALPATIFDERGINDGDMVKEPDVHMGLLYPLDQPEVAFSYSVADDGPGNSILDTPLRTYNAAAGAFVDLITDPPGRDEWARSLQRLRIRVRSQEPSRGDTVPSPLRGQMLNPSPASTYAATTTAAAAAADTNSTGRVQARIWPPDEPEHFDAKFDAACSVLNPQGAVRSIDWAADERNLVYFPQPYSSDAKGPRPIVVVSFDPALCLGGMTHLVGDFTSPESPFDARRCETLRWRRFHRPNYTVLRDGDDEPLAFDMSALAGRG